MESISSDQFIAQHGSKMIGRTYTNEFGDDSSNCTDRHESIALEVGADTVVGENKGRRLARKTLYIGDNTVQDGLDVVNDRRDLRGGQVVRLEAL